LQQELEQISQQQQQQQRRQQEQQQAEGGNSDQLARVEALERTMLAKDWAREKEQRTAQHNSVRIKDLVEVTSAKPRPGAFTEADLRAEARTFITQRLGISGPTADGILQGARVSALPWTGGQRRTHVTVVIHCTEQRHKQQLMAARGRLMREGTQGLPSVWHYFTPAQEKYFTAHLFEKYKAARQQQQATIARAPASISERELNTIKQGVAVHLDFKTMVVRVGGMALNAPDYEQAMRLGKQPGELWAVDEAPDC
jgi:hypothetical protein